MINSAHSHVPGRKTLHMDGQVGLSHPRPGQKQDASEIKASSLQCLLPHSQAPAPPNTLHTYYRKHISEASRGFQGVAVSLESPPRRSGPKPGGLTLLCSLTSLMSWQGDQSRR